MPRVEIVTSIGVLFAGEPDLMKRLNAFLPEQLKFEMQKDAAVLKRTTPSMSAQVSTTANTSQDSDNVQVQKVCLMIFLILF